MVTDADRYHELNQTARHYDQQLWVIPCVAYGILFLAVRAVLSNGIGLATSAGIVLLTSLVFAAFVIQYGKVRYYQFRNQEDITRIGASANDSPEGPQFVGREGSVATDPFLVRAVTSLSAANCVMWVMIITLIIIIVVLAALVNAALTSTNTVAPTVASTSSENASDPPHWFLQTLLTGGIAGAFTLLALFAKEWLRRHARREPLIRARIEQKETLYRELLKEVGNAMTYANRVLKKGTHLKELKARRDAINELRQSGITLFGETLRSDLESLQACLKKIQSDQRDTSLVEEIDKLHQDLIL